MDSVHSRRQFLKFVSSQSTLLGMSPFFLQGLSACVSTSQPSTLKGLSPSRQDQLRLMDGLNYKVLARCNDSINDQDEKFGYNNDFTCFIGFDKKPDEGLLWVNHESVIPQFIHNKSTQQLSRSISEIVKEQEAVGGSILHIKKVNGQWYLQFNSKYNRRIHGRTKIPFSHGHSIQGSTHAVGTIANCAGGLTPWGSFLTSEENYDGFYGEARWVKGQRSVHTFEKFNWWKRFPLPPRTLWLGSRNQPSHW